MNNNITKLRPNGGGAINLTSNGYLKLNKDSKVLVAVRYYGEEVALAKQDLLNAIWGEEVRSALATVAQAVYDSIEDGFVTTDYNYSVVIKEWEGDLSGVITELLDYCCF